MAIKTNQTQTIRLMKINGDDDGDDAIKECALFDFNRRLEKYILSK